MNRNIWIGIVVVVLLAVGGWWYVSQSTTLSESTQQPASNSSSNVITITAPNGGESFKIGSTVRVSWQGKNLPPDASVDLQLATISGNRPTFDGAGNCTNCVNGTSAIVLEAPSIANGAGSVNWEVGKKLYPLFTPPGPGNNYIILATVSRPATDAEVAECRKKYPSGPQCNALSFVLGRDASDTTFSLAN